jgi:hypothetical protein
MKRDLERYRELLIEDMNMFVGYNMSKIITLDEYKASSEVVQAIEKILEVKYGEKESNKVRWSTI